MGAEEMRLRDDIAAAFDTIEAADKSAESRESVREASISKSADEKETSDLPASSAGQEEQKSPAKAELPRDEAGRFKKSDGAKDSATKEGAPAKPESDGTPEENVKKKENAFTVPQSWKGDMREKWAALPSDIQAEITRREREMSVELRESSEERKLARAFRDAAQPFSAMIQAEGSNPLMAFQSLLNTAWQLRASAPAQKAQLVASMIQQFGVPIDALASALEGKGQPAGQAAAPPQPQQFRDPRLDVFLEQQRQTIERETAKEMEAFMSTHEHMDTVRETMADILEGFEKIGKEIDLETAYKMAVAQYPEIVRSIWQKETSGKGGEQAIARARIAGSSLKPSSGERHAPAKKYVPGANLRGDIMAAFGELEDS